MVAQRLKALKTLSNRRKCKAKAQIVDKRGWALPQNHPLLGIFTKFCHNFRPTVTIQDIPPTLNSSWFLLDFMLVQNR